MKKQLLLGAALLTAAGAFAQSDGVDITPSSYHFNTATQIPFANEFYSNVNIKAGSSNVYAEMNLGDYYQDGLWLDSSAGQSSTQQDAFRAAWQLLDLGGNVGQVAAFGGKDSGIVDVLKTAAPALAERWDNFALDPESTQAFRLNLFMDPDKCPTASEGYIHFKMVYNIWSAKNTSAANAFNPFNQGVLFSNIGIITNDNNSSRGWSQNPGMLPSDCFKVYEDDGTFQTDANGNPVWDPTKWMVCEFDFTLPDADDSGKIYIPARLGLQAEASQTYFNNFALFIQDISFTFMSGETLENDAIFSNYSLTSTTLQPFEVSTDGGEGGEGEGEGGDGENGIESIGIDMNAPVEYYNLQGVKVANPEKGGLYILKQGNVTKKAIVK